MVQIIGTVQVLISTSTSTVQSTRTINNPNDWL